MNDKPPKVILGILECTFVALMSWLCGFVVGHDGVTTIFHNFGWHTLKLCLVVLLVAVIVVAVRHQARPQ